MKNEALNLRFLPFIFLSLFLAVNAHALDPTKSIRQMTHEAWTRESSLPQASVQSIIQTSDGYIWLGTQEGLVRFDGVRFVQMNSEDAGSIWEDRDGSLWIASPQSGSSGTGTGRPRSSEPPEGSRPGVAIHSG